MTGEKKPTNQANLYRQDESDEDPGWKLEETGRGDQQAEEFLQSKNSQNYDASPQPQVHAPGSCSLAQ
ncbi:hypothetical protein V6N12_001171 [Hibiscus sabdariffa]|uniref:Uncharacterized protein n=1 Tax=Hibiscus sabdariffa TaxID=183260 RepID=A0ABR2C8D6_9ROSI